MSALLRLSETSPLAIALAGGVALYEADLFTLTLADGVTTFNCTSWPADLTVGLITYASRAPWLEAKSWNVANTMEVPELTVLLRALNAPFNGGANLKTQIHNGLLDGAALTYSAAYMETPGDTAALGAVELFGGVVAGVDVTGTTATIDVRGKTNILDQFAPRNLYQIACNHAFCDVGCTLARSAFTFPFTVGSASPTSSFLPWSGTPPSDATNYQLGEVTMTSGEASGQTRTVAAASSAGLTLAYPLYEAPAPGDTFSAFQGCDKTFDSGSGQSCTDYSNTQHWRGYDQVPPPNSAY